MTTYKTAHQRYIEHCGKGKSLHSKKKSTIQIHLTWLTRNYEVYKQIMGRMNHDIAKYIEEHKP